MKVQRADLYRVSLPLIHEFETSSHRKGSIEHILVRLTDAAGYSGWGECACPSDPYYCGENVDIDWLILHDYLLPALLEGEWETPQQATALTARVSGNRFAHAAIDIACWDLYCHQQQLPLADALGGSAATIEAGVSLGIERSISALLAEVDHHVAQGYRRVKLKIKPGWDLEPARAVRAAHPDLALQVDANCAYGSWRGEPGVFSELDRLGLLMIEQPYAETDLLSHSALQDAIDTPVCLDESVLDAATARTAIALDACKVINIKVSRVGGLGPALAVHDVCRDAGVAAWCGGMHEFGIGRAANVALASLPGFTLPSDVSGSDKYYAQDIVEPPVIAHAGRVQVPREAPGIGYEVKLERVEAQAVCVATLQRDQRG